MSLPPDLTIQGGDVQSTPTRRTLAAPVTHSNVVGLENGETVVEFDSGHELSTPTLMSFSSPSRAGESLLPAFSSKHISHLPTPQSPNDGGLYAGGAPTTPESPLPSGSQSIYTSLAASFPQQLLYQSLDIRPDLSSSRSQQILTPESSPLADRNATRRFTTPPYKSVQSDTPRERTSSVKLETDTYATLAPAHSISLPASSPDVSRSTLSSPFMAKLSLGSDHIPLKTKSPGPSQPGSPPTQDTESIHIVDVFSADPNMPTSTPRPTMPHRSSGSEIERIRLQMLEHGMAHFQQAESRRPEYLKRMKRSLDETDPAMGAVLDLEEREAALPGVGIAVSPMKGRRLKLFQETSEESFEESLMAGGYERYRNADWMQQSTPGAAGSSTSTVGVELELSDKELRKRRRLAAFGKASQSWLSTAKLQPVEVEGKGRVLLDTHAEDLPILRDASPNKKKPARRKKKGVPEAVKEILLGAERSKETGAPNWPDSEFPWSLRVEEQNEKARATQEERLRWIEKFLDRDSDEEDDDEDEEILPSTMWGQVYEDAPMPSRRGRGKMVGLKSSDGVSKRAFFPSDPADARAALMSKRSVRTLSYRTQQRLTKGQPKSWAEDSDDEDMCFCHGRDDGRDLVQCDACTTWYHLQCIGIKSIKELGKEEDPWFCGNCTAAGIARTPSPELALSSEPTFVPTDDRLTPSTPRDPLFYSSIPPSPASPWNSSRQPQTPTRGEDTVTPFSSGSSNDHTRYGPSTPLSSTHAVRVYNTPGAYDAFASDDTGFDPTSTPSRGIKFGAPFATPKNTLWSARAQGLFQTPSRPGSGAPVKARAGAALNTSSSTEGSGALPFFSSPYRPLLPYDDSPVRRTKPGEGPKFGVARRLLESPLAPRFPGAPYALLQESPIMRSTPKERMQEFDSSAS